MYNKFNYQNQAAYSSINTESRLANYGWQWQAARQGHCASHTTPQTDILELDDQFILEIALPGVLLDDVEIRAEENYLTVCAKRTPAMFEERANVLRKELPLGIFSRQFVFDQPVLVEHIEARMEYGILFVSVPKLEAARRIPVSHGSIDTVRSQVKTHVQGKAENLRSGKEVSVK
jgi:HSP20 family molecular chaperone IbpA